MSELTDRLRAYKAYPYWQYGDPIDLLDDAADRIDALEAEVARVTAVEADAARAAGVWEGLEKAAEYFRNEGLPTFARCVERLAQEKRQEP